MYQIKVAKEICEKCISDHSVKPNLTIEEQAMLFPTFFLAYKEKIIEKSEVRTKIGKKIIIKFDNISNNEFIDEIISLSQYIFAKIKSSDKFKYEIDANIEVIFEQEELIEKDKLNQLKQALILIQKIADCFGHNEYEFIDDFTKIKIENENGTRTINYSNLLFELNINSLYNKIFHFEYNYFKSINNKTLIFINMLNKGKSNILNKKNTETFEGTTIPVRHFWNNNNKDKIIQKLFVEEKNNPEYETARQTILDYYDVSSYEELLNE